MGRAACGAAVAGRRCSEHATSSAPVPNPVRPRGCGEAARTGLPAYHGQAEDQPVPGVVVSRAEEPAAAAFVGREGEQNGTPSRGRQGGGGGCPAAALRWHIRESTDDPVPPLLTQSSASCPAGSMCKSPTCRGGAMRSVGVSECGAGSHFRPPPILAPPRLDRLTTRARSPGSPPARWTASSRPSRAWGRSPRSRSSPCLRAHAARRRIVGGRSGTAAASGSCPDGCKQRRHRAEHPLAPALSSPGQAAARGVGGGARARPLPPGSGSQERSAASVGAAAGGLGYVESARWGPGLGAGPGFGHWSAPCSTVRARALLSCSRWGGGDG